MKVYKNTVWRLTIISTMFFVFAQTALAQQLKAGEIVYSRLPTDLLSPPTGANSPTIWAVGQNGSNDRMITSGMEPRLSDDGRFLLFRRIIAAQGDVYHYNPYADQANGQLWVRDLTNNSETMIFDFSTNNRRLLGYDLAPFTNQIVFDFGSLIYKMNLDGTGLVPLEYYFGTNFPRENDTFPVVRRNDAHLVANNRDRGSYGLVTRTLGSELPFDLPNTTGADYNPSWSNDNQFVGFTTLRNLGCLGYDSSPNGCNYPYFFNKISKITPAGTGRTSLTDLSDINTNGISFGTVWTEDNSKIIAAARIGGVAGLYAFNTDGSGTHTLIPVSAGNAPDFVGSLVFAAAPPKTPFDYDGDGKADVSVFRPSSGVWYLQNSSGGVASSPFGVAGDKITPADFDGDGKTDLAVYRPSTGVWYILKSTGGVTILQFGIAEDIHAPADFDGDGRADIAVFRPSSGVWYINGSSSGIRTLAFGQSGDVPVAADYDGDGRADVAVYRPSTGVWYEQRSSGGFYAALFGISTDLPATADYDGDGKADIAVFRPSTGIWYIMQSTSGFTAVQFGQAGDRPSAADYDGDGRADVGVFRPATGIWYEQRSSGGVTTLQFGQAGDIPTEAAFVP